MAVDVFLKLGDVKGESKDSKHEGEIDVLSWSWGISQTGLGSMGGGSGAGKANFSDLNFMHALDKASPVLMMKCATGDHFDDATLVVAKGGQGTAGLSDHQVEGSVHHERAAVRKLRAPDGERLDELRTCRSRVQAAEAGRFARRRRALHLRRQEERG